MAAAVKPVFTIAQSQAVRLAIKERLEWEETPSSEARAPVYGGVVATAVEYGHTPGRSWPSPRNGARTARTAKGRWPGNGRSNGRGNNGNASR